MNKFLSDLEPLARNAMRIMVGMMYWSHGAQKLFGWFGWENPVAITSRFGAAAIIETVGGLLIVTGFKHRPVAFIISGEMAVTYWWMHVIGRSELWWWANRGEIPALYAFVFLFIAASGGGDFSIDGWLKKRRATG